MSLEIELKHVANWGGKESKGTMIITNLSTVEPVKNWAVEIETQNFQIMDIWNFSKNGKVYSGKEWNPDFAPGQVQISDFSYSGDDQFIFSSPNPNIKMIGSYGNHGGLDTANDGQEDEGNEKSKWDRTTKNDFTEESQQKMEGKNHGKNNNCWKANPVNEIKEGIKINNDPNKNHESKITLKKKVRFGYFTEWCIYQRKFGVEKIPAHNLSHVIYAFMLPNPSEADLKVLKESYPFPPLPYRPPPQVPEGQLIFHDEAGALKNIANLKELKATHPHLKIGISVLGWTLSWHYSNIIANPITRKTFVNSSVQFILENDFDFLDVDFEFPGKKGASYNICNPLDATNHVITLKELRHEFDRLSPNKYIELTAATGIDPVVLKSYNGAQGYLDYILGMHYDVCGAGWSVGNHSPLYRNPANKDLAAGLTVAESIKYLLMNGWRKNQLCVGIPLYGRGWRKVTPYDSDHPIFGTSDGSPAASHSGSAGEPGFSSWRHLEKEFRNPDWTLFFDEAEKAAFAVKRSTGETWSYENPESAREKAKYVVDHDLAGVLFWELSDNVRDGLEGNPTHDIIEAVNQYFQSTCSS